ncbi:MAG: ComEC/Rec2 family competence protein, partial [Verrucomicrobia bacterium]|nr:ComEC/Rec2 family competence protein [Verrucomicrobiota bacterium]
LISNLRRFGLQHILVASGFHFTLIATLFMAIFGLWLPWRAVCVALLLMTTGYLLFIGLTPSVLRAWCSCTLVLCAKLLSCKSSGLNALGIGAVAVLLFEPTAADSLSFQLSFLATGAILLFYPPLHRRIKALFPTHTLSEAITFPFIEQLVVVLLAFFCSSVALVLSVSIVMLPMSLFAFHAFPLMGMLYNCFFPFVVSIAVSLLCIALLLSWIGPIAAMFFSAASCLTEGALKLVTHAPAWLDITMYRGELSGITVVLYLTLLFTIRIGHPNRLNP